MTTERKLCGQEHPERPGVTCVRSPCVEYHRSEAGVLWTAEAAPRPAQRTDPVKVAAVVAGARAKARHTDPKTSHEAAATVNLTNGQEMVLEALQRGGPMHDEMIKIEVSCVQGDFISLSGCRTRRKELVDLGLVEDSGTTVLTEHGRKTIVWKVVER